MFREEPAWLQVNLQTLTNIEANMTLPCEIISHAIDWSRSTKIETCPNQPVLYRKAASQWEACQKWTFDVLSRDYGTVRCKANRAWSCETESTSLGDYIGQLTILGDADPYMLHWQFEQDTKDLSAAFAIPNCFRSWLYALEDKVNPRFRWLIFGPPGAKSTLHVDFLGTSTWNALIVGSKRWFFLPPAAASYECFSRKSLLAEDGTVDPHLLSLAYLGLHTCKQSPGDIVFVPSGWWHQVYYEAESISLTENFINASNVEHAKATIKTAGLQGWTEVLNTLSQINLGY